MFTLKKNYCICFLDDYSVQKMPEAKKALLDKSYVYIGIGGGVTRDIQKTIQIFMLL